MLTRLDLAKTRATANLAALAELLKPEPDPAILANYEGCRCASRVIGNDMQPHK